MSPEMEELVREGMREFTATMRVSPDLAARASRQYRQRRVLRAGLALTAAGAVAAAGGVAAAVGVAGTAHGPAAKTPAVAAPALGVHLLAALNSVSGDILYVPDAGAKALGGGQYPAFPRPGQIVQVRVGPDEAHGVIFKDGEYVFKMPHASPAKNYTANLDQGGLNLTGTSISVDHQNRTWRSCHMKFVLGFTLDGAQIRGEIRTGQFTVAGRAKIRGQQAIVLRFNVPPSHEAPPHVVAERMWVNARTYLPVQGATSWSNGEHSVYRYLFLRPTPKRLAKLHPVIPAGFTRSACPKS